MSWATKSSTEVWTLSGLLQLKRSSKLRGTQPEGAPRLRVRRKQSFWKGLIRPPHSPGTGSCCGCYVLRCQS